MMQNVEIRTGRSIARGSKRLGVLNVESRIPGAFFSLDEDRIQTLVRQAALVYDRIETDRKFDRLSQIETEFAHAGRLNPEHILKVITDTLGFEVVNISLVDTDTKRIKTRYLAGLSKEEEKRFKQLADHALEGTKLDIQADIVRSRNIEVPAPDDPRFDHTIFEAFAHRDLIRVFLPMVSPVGNQVVGTVEAGYKRAFRPFIYERDVRLLKDFVDFVTVALLQSREEVLDKIMHDLRAPAAALWGDVDYLNRKFQELPDYRIQNKLADLALDSELVLLQVSEVEKFFGGPSPQPTRERTVVYRDIVIKCVNQLRGMISKSGYDTKKVYYNPQDAGRMVLYLDPLRMNDVVLNLMMNAIKYAEEDPAKFAIRIDLSETRDVFVIKFKDWGIGIKSDFKDKIFDSGFRAPEAIARCVTGSGLGLYISRSRMREMGGDLSLANNYKPTEFHVVLPKSLKEAR
jgi:signal transduction histidine kinase